MNSVRFELVKIVDCCFNSASTCKKSWNSAFRAVFKDRRQRPTIFFVVNLIVSTINVVVFTVIRQIIKRRVDTIYRGIFIAVTVLTWVTAIGLVVAVKRRNHCLCHVWCVSEIIFIFLYLLLTLPYNVVVLSELGVGLLIIGGLIKLHGLYVIYYFSLEVKYSPHIHQDRISGEDIASVKYAVSPANKPTLTRRETDLTSTESPRNSLPYDEECHDSVLDDDSPTRESFQFFETGKNCGLGEPQYSEIIIQGQSKLLAGDLGSLPPLLPCSSNDNIIISDLMCGGSSTLNKEFER